MGLKERLAYVNEERVKAGLRPWPKRFTKKERDDGDLLEYGLPVVQEDTPEQLDELMKK